LSRQNLRPLLTGILAALLLFSIPAVDHHTRAVSLLHTLSAPPKTLPEDVAETRITINGPNGPIRGKLFWPTAVAHPPAVVIAHGVHPDALEEPRLLGFAHAIAANGIAVLAPELKDLASFRISPESIDVIGAAAHHMRERVHQPVGLFGLSFSGGLALIAAADERYAKDVAFVVSVGAHHDMRRVAEFFLTDEAPRPDGSKLHLRAHEYGALVLIYANLNQFFAPADIPYADAALRALVTIEDATAARLKSTGMSPAGRAVLEKILARDRAALLPQLTASIAASEDEMRRVSPSGHLRGLRVPVLLVHGSGDDVVPPTELQWLAREAPAGLVEEALVSPLLSHVDVGDKPGFGDNWRLVHFIAEILEEADSAASRPAAVSD